MKTFLSSFLLLILGVILVVFISCQNISENELSHPVQESNSKNAFLSERFHQLSPKSVAILPFIDSIKASHKDKEENFLTVDSETIRKIFYGHFSPLGYLDIELNHIDRILDINGISADTNLKKISSQKLGQLLNADAIIYGDLNHFNITYAVLYSQISLGISMEMISTKTGEILWRVDDIKKNHNVRIGLDPISIMTGAAQAAIVLRKKNIIRLAEDLSRDLVRTIPAAKTERTSITYKGWVDSDSDIYKSKGETIKVYFKGKTDLKIVFDIKSIIENVPMEEKEIGIYKGIYKVKKGDNIIKPKIIIRFTERDKKDFDNQLELKTEIILDTTPPPPLKIVDIKRLSNGFLLVWRYPEIKDFDSFKIYRRNIKGDYILLSRTTDKSYFLKGDMKDTQSYILTAVDMTGNESEGIELVPKF